VLGHRTTRPFMVGQGDIEEHIFSGPTGATFGTAMRAFGVLMQQGERADGRPDCFVVLSWSDQRVSSIQDFFLCALRDRRR
jgi:hypothetical protein